MESRAGGRVVRRLGSSAGIAALRRAICAVAPPQRAPSAPPEAPRMPPPPPLPSEWAVIAWDTAPHDAAGYHDIAFQSAQVDVVGPNASPDPARARPAVKGLYIGRGDWKLRDPKSAHWQSIPGLHVHGDGMGAYQTPKNGTIINLEGPDTVWRIDGCPFGTMRDISFVGTNKAKASDVPRDVLRFEKSLPQGTGPVQTIFTIGSIHVGGAWRGAGFRMGTDGWNETQEDNLLVESLWITGGYEPNNADQRDRWQIAAHFGYPNWANNRAHHVKHLYALGGRTAVMTARTGLQIDYLAAWNARDIVGIAGEIGKVAIMGGEAETCQRFVMDHMGFFGAEHSLSIAHFQAKLDQWRPMGGTADGEPANWRDVIGYWASGGALLLDNVRVSHVGDSVGPLPAAKPRFRTHDQPAIRIRTRSSACWGYTMEEAFGPVGGAAVTHEDWKDVDAAGLVTAVRDGRWIHDTRGVRRVA